MAYVDCVCFVMRLIPPICLSFWTMDGLLDLAFSSRCRLADMTSVSSWAGSWQAEQQAGNADGGPPLSPPTGWPALCSVRRVLDEFSAAVPGYQSQLAV